jgi:hypothetical protein
MVQAGSSGKYSRSSKLAVTDGAVGKVWAALWSGIGVNALQVAVEMRPGITPEKSPPRQLDG